MNMKLNDHAEPGQADVGKDRIAATPVSQIWDEWNFMNVKIHVGSSPEVEIPQPQGWVNCEKMAERQR